MNLAQLLQEGYNDIGADIQEGGTGNQYQWVTELQALINSTEKLLDQCKGGRVYPDAIIDASIALSTARGQST